MAIIKSGGDEFHRIHKFISFLSVLAIILRLFGTGKTVTWEKNPAVSDFCGLRKQKFLFVILATSCVSTLLGCVNVKPYEREYLADPIMQLNEGTLSTLYEQHMHRALSQGLIGMPVAGGGCGCEQ